MDIQWLGHASFKIKTDQLIYIDPWEIKSTEPANIILISHNHYDHLSKPDIEKIRSPKTLIVTSADCAAEIGGKGVNVIKPNDTISLGAVKITGVPAYNVYKKFHPPTNNWLGFIIEYKDERLYYAGDTDRTSEMDSLKDITYALLPVGGTYTMTADEAAAAANTFKPKIAIPYHWGKIVGSKNDAERFKKLFTGETRILQI